MGRGRNTTLGQKKREEEAKEFIQSVTSSCTRMNLDANQQLVHMQRRLCRKGQKKRRRRAQSVVGAWPGATEGTSGGALFTGASPSSSVVNNSDENPTCFNKSFRDRLAVTRPQDLRSLNITYILSAVAD